MSPISRRQFLSGAAVLGGAAAVGGWKLLDAAGDDADGDASTSGSPASTSARASGAAGTLVLVTLYGGNDALNTVVPVGDARLRARSGVRSPSIRPRCTRSSDGFALHPALAGCKALWDDERLAVVHGVGFEHLDRSHFHCMDVWQAGSEDELATGWVGRWLDADGADPLAAVSVGRSLPLLMRGREALGRGRPGGRVRAARRCPHARPARGTDRTPTTIDHRSPRWSRRPPPTSSPSSTRWGRCSRRARPATSSKANSSPTDWPRSRR